ncbi:IS110 family transposase [Streptomyces sp. NA02950]|uniref:IS110 family transposase n=1 Tax=Streptomyces sp. NA02950 TaxID=2742137 RepID=UPI0015925161|nr:IS110 family transposase [Streptomyces sp. NA02950]QKV91270.1 IS110 family transposase [Streptomyces sp. NA02950]QKV93019.1 IS110 family transposase [Streptomyces sp. NA02950]QKV96117.1 IS110 family transposase [Streptomyces sp. NA02950]QKV96505.1 IS110 family transposase [Streptomyces sp. NA02950]QKV96550.1 IS110 family transposase [Streptomyces sp. NA02950]
MSTSHTRIWVGIDAGKGHHWAVAVDADGETLFSTKVINDESQILALIDTARERADEVRWAVDISGRASTLLLALLIAHGQQVVYVPGRTVNRMSGAYRGEGKTDAKDARVIADQARMRPKDFAPLNTPPELVTTLQVLTNYRADLIADRVRLINRLRDLLVGICPALERAFDYSAAKGPIVMLTEYQTPAALRRIGVKRLTTWLERRKVRSADTVATKAVEAAQSQMTVLPGEKRAAKLVCDLAHQLLTLDERIKDNDREIRETFRDDDRAEVIESMPGMGPILGAEFVAIVGDLSGYRDAGRLASHAGLAPVARDSGRRSGNYHRPKRYNRRLRHIFYLAAQTAMMRPGPSRDYYLKKRSEGLLHTQALLALARRRVDVLWAMLRDKRPFTPAPPVTQAA